MSYDRSGSARKVAHWVRSMSSTERGTPSWRLQTLTTGAAEAPLQKRAYAFCEDFAP